MNRRSRLIGIVVASLLAAGLSAPASSHQTPCGPTGIGNPGTPINTNPKWRVCCGTRAPNQQSGEQCTGMPPTQQTCPAGKQQIYCPVGSYPITDNANSGYCRLD